MLVKALVKAPGLGMQVWMSMAGPEGMLNCLAIPSRKPGCRTLAVYQVKCGRAVSPSL